MKDLGIFTKLTTEGTENHDLKKKISDGYKKYPTAMPSFVSLTILSSPDSK